ncbi:MAG: acyltransferase family protein [Chitinophaga sp.]
MIRLHNLDYLRGMAALGIMFYHILSWSLGEFTSETFFGRVGIYGVSIFYVLSGLTLYHVYWERMVPNLADVATFLKKRFFRIFPLLWLVMIFSIIISKKMPSIDILFLNLTGLFGLLKWDAYISVGAWSIGNELVFYLFFPVFILLVRKSIPLFIFFLMLLLGVYIYFAFGILDATKPLASQWKNYVNPLNQVFLFLSGFLIGLIGKRIKLNTLLNLILLFAAFALFLFYPAEENIINLVTGFSRLVFTLSCIVICFCFYKLTMEMPLWVDRPLAMLGEISYSVYLLHPLVYAVINFVLLHWLTELNLWQVKLSITVLATLVASYLTYNYYEKYFMKFGKRAVPASSTLGVNYQKTVNK